MEKIKEKGSLYAVPSTNESSRETELKELMDNMEPVIAKPDKLFREKEITDLYRKFRDQIEKVREEEENAQLLRQE